MTNIKSRVMHMAHVFARQGMDKSYALTWAWHMETLRKGMQNGIVRFWFTKKDGSIRDAKATLHPLLIPLDKMPHMDLQHQPVYTAIAFFDLDKQEWRSFRITDFLSIREAYALTEVIL